MARLCLKVGAITLLLGSALAFFVGNQQLISRNDAIISLDKTPWTVSPQSLQNNICQHLNFNELQLHAVRRGAQLEEEEEEEEDDESEIFDEIDQFTAFDDDAVLDDDDDDDDEIEPIIKKPAKKTTKRKAKTKKQMMEDERKELMESTVFRAPLETGEYLSPWDHPMSVELLEEIGHGRKTDPFSFSEDELNFGDEDENALDDDVFKKGMRGLVVMVASNYSQEDYKQVQQLETVIKDNFGNKVGFKWVPVWFEWRGEKTNQREILAWFEGIENRQLYRRELDCPEDELITDEKIQEIVDEINFLTCDETFFHVYGDCYDPYTYGYMDW